MKVFSIVTKTNFDKFLKTYYSCKKFKMNRELIIYTDSLDIASKLKREHFSVKSINIYDKQGEVNFKTKLLLNNLDIQENESFMYIEPGIEVERNMYPVVKQALLFSELLFLEESLSFNFFAGVFSEEIKNTLETTGTFSLDTLRDKLTKKESNFSMLLPSGSLKNDICDFLD